MNHDEIFIAQLEDYLEGFDGLTPLPQRVRNAIRAELPSVRQVRTRPGYLRFFSMLSNASVGARAGLAAATLVVAVVLGAAVLSNNRSGNAGGPGTPSPTASPTRSATPSATTSASTAAGPLTLKDAPFAPCDPADTTAKTCMAAGTYQLNNWRGPRTWPVMVTIDVPAGWFDWDAGPGADAALVGGGPDARGNSGWGVLFATVGHVSTDPCDTAKGVIPAAQVDTPEKFAALMATWPAFSATTPEPITVDGHKGVKVNLTSKGTACLAGTLWVTTSDFPIDLYPMIVSGTTLTAPGTFEIVDTGSGLLVIRTTDFPQTSPNELAGGIAMDPKRHAADQAALHAIVDSIRLTALPAST